MRALAIVLISGALLPALAGNGLAAPAKTDPRLNPAEQQKQIQQKRQQQAIQKRQGQTNTSGQSKQRHQQAQDIIRNLR